jgi:transcription elongation factor Elf1
MGKRKGFKHHAVKKRALDTHFNCPFCNHAGWAASRTLRFGGCHPPAAGCQE